MKVLVAPNALKGSLSAKEAAECMDRGIKKTGLDIEVVTAPFSDGGDGLVEVLTDLLGAHLQYQTVHGPRWDKLKVPFCYHPQQRLAAVEMARASGLSLLPAEKRNPDLTTTYGTGELIKAALNLDVNHLLIGVGGSATNDGGVGMAAALGVRFLDKNNKDVHPVGSSLGKINRIDVSGLDPRLKKTVIEVVCDVDNVLLGEKGATRIYGPQKGASPEQIEKLEAGMQNLAEVVQADLNIDMSKEPGSGAAGGLAAGLYAFLGARLRKGVEVMLEKLEIEQKMADVDLVLTAEGQTDSQIVFGKGPAGVAGCAQKHKVPCILLAGSIQPNNIQWPQLGITAALSICPGPVDLDLSMKKAEQFLTKTTQEVIRIFAAGQYGYLGM